MKVVKMLYINFFNEFSNYYDNLDPQNTIYKIKDLPTAKIIDTNEQLDKIAFDEWGDETLWWILAIYNNIVDPFLDDTNRTISIPDISSIETLILNSYQG